MPSPLSVIRISEDPAVFDFSRHSSRSGIDGIFYQLFDHRRRSARLPLLLQFYQWYFHLILQYSSYYHPCTPVTLQRFSVCSADGSMYLMLPAVSWKQSPSHLILLKYPHLLRCQTRCHLPHINLIVGFGTVADFCRCFCLRCTACCLNLFCTLCDIRIT